MVLGLNPGTAGSMSKTPNSQLPNCIMWERNVSCFGSAEYYKCKSDWHYYKD